MYYIILLQIQITCYNIQEIVIIGKGWWIQMGRKLLSWLLMLCLLVFTTTIFSSKVKADTTKELSVYVGFDAFQGDSLTTDSNEPKMFYGIKTLFATNDAKVMDNKYLRLTDQQAGYATSVVRKNPITLKNGFSTYFQVDMHLSYYLDNHGDGMCFLLYDATNGYQIGHEGFALGYHGGSTVRPGIVGDSLAIEMDTFNNGSGECSTTAMDTGSPWYHVAIDTNDLSYPYASNLANVIHKDATRTYPSNDYTKPTDDGPNSIAHYYSDLYDTVVGGSPSNYVNVWVDMTPITGEPESALVTVTYGKSTDRSSTSNYSFQRRISSRLLSKTVYAGFCASTGGSSECHDVRAWLFSNEPVAGGLNPVNGNYSQAASSVTLDLQNADGETSLETPAKALIQTLDVSGAAIGAKQVGISFDDGTVVTAQTDASGKLIYTLPELTPGMHKITVATSDGNSHVDKSFKVIGQTRLMLTTEPSSTTQNLGSNVTLKALLTNVETLDKQTVEFYDGTILLGTSLTNQRGEATFTYIPELGNYNYHAVYGGSTYGIPADSNIITYKISKIATNPRLVVTPVKGTNRPIKDSQILLSITGLPKDATGTVQFAQGGVPIGSPVALVGGEATCSYPLGPSDTYSFSITYSGDSRYMESSAELKDYTLSKSTQTITLHTKTNVSYGIGTFTATTSGGLGSGDYVWSITNESKPGIASIDQSGKITVNGVGSFTVTVYHKGDDDYNDSNVASASITVDQLNGPKTEDSMQPLIYVIAMFLSIGGCAWILIRKRKRD